ncbi:MAG: hypothetical protein M1817_006081 [Caeruleum heppii]|nr:MAG: hypothetical protein M1817_006081 [Caeruleum heppii]
MGFTTGLFGGITLTTSILYLSLSLHQRNRAVQSLYLRQQAHILTSLVEEPSPASAVRSRVDHDEREDDPRRPRESLVEAVKDRWNDEVESAVKWVYNVDWASVRVGVEGAVAEAWSKAFREVEGSSGKGKT